jgi:metallo-beta-lactamase family protein
MQIIHHGAVNGVTGSCHQLDINAQHPSVTLSIMAYFKGLKRQVKTLHPNCK